MGRGGEEAKKIGGGEERTRGVEEEGRGGGKEEKSWKGGEDRRRGEDRGRREG